MEGFSKRKFSNGFKQVPTTKANSPKNSVSVWKRAFTAKSNWTEKEEFLDVIYWFRQFLGILFGVIWGIIPLKGFLGIFLFCVITVVLLFLYISSYQAVDEDEYGGIWELLREGFVTSFAGFLVTWILFYSWIHFK